MEHSERSYRRKECGRFYSVRRLLVFQWRQNVVRAILIRRVLLWQEVVTILVDQEFIKYAAFHLKL